MWTKDDIKTHFINLKIPDDVIVDFTRKENPIHGAIGFWAEREFEKYSKLDFNNGEGVDLPSGFNGDSNPWEVKTQEINSNAFLTIGAYSKNAIVTSSGKVCFNKLTTNLIYIQWCKNRGIVKSVDFINNNTKFVKDDVSTYLKLAAAEISEAKETPKHREWLNGDRSYPFVMANKGKGMIQVRMTKTQLLGRTLNTGFLFE